MQIKAHLSGPVKHKDIGIVSIIGVTKKYSYTQNTTFVKFIFNILNNNDI